MAIVPTTLEEWRNLADSSKVITSGQTFQQQRKNGCLYVLQGAIEILPLVGDMLIGPGNGKGNITSLFQVMVHYPDGTQSGRYNLVLRGIGSPLNRDGRKLEQILLQHKGGVADGLVGGNYRSLRGFVVNYIRTPLVEAVVFSGKVEEVVEYMQLGVAVP